MTDRLHASTSEPTQPPSSLHTRTLLPGEMTSLLRQAQNAKPAFNLQAERGKEDFETIPFETTMMMDRTALGRPDRTLRPDEFPSAAPEDNEEDESTYSAPPAINLYVEKTPAEFSHLYAALERQIAGVGDVTLLSGETLGSDRPYVLGITSALLGEGKTTVALHLAMTIARDTFKRVCLIDLSLGKGDLAARLGVPVRGEGVIPVLEDNSHVVPTLQIAGLDNLVIIPAGKVPSNAPRLVRSPRVAQLIQSARTAFDVVVVDMPAVATDNALPLTRHIDGLLVVARAGVTPRDVVNQALDVLGRDKVIGVTLNRIQSTGPAWLRKRLAGA
ncbi:MAG: CpsD/CapB family tyrosine-protein kinase [Janthinobacterium lividum]